MGYGGVAPVAAGRCSLGGLSSARAFRKALVLRALSASLLTQTHPPTHPLTRARPQNMEPWDGKTPKSAVGGEGAKANKNIFKEMAVADKLAAANSSAGGDEVRPFSTSGMVATDHDIA